jgi:raffinose/stachyose/melibiose transport system permease protein
MRARIAASRSIAARRPRTWLGRGTTYLVLMLFTGIVLFPLVAMVFGSFKTQFQFYANPWGVPSTLIWDNYRYAWNVAQIPRFLLNSIIVAAGTVCLTLLLASAAAYGFSSFQFRGSRPLFLLFILLLIIPVPVAIIPLYVIVVRLHLVDTYLALILPYTSGSLPLAIFLLRASFQAIPREITSAARIDGCSHFGAYVRIVLPLARPGLATVTILAFISSWNEFFLALIFIRDPALMTLPLGLRTFVFQYSTQWTYLFAALTLSIVPIVVVYVALQRQFISGLASGALAG